MKHFFLSTLIVAAVFFSSFFQISAVHAQSKCILNGQEVSCAKLKAKAAPVLGVGVAALVGFGGISIVAIVFWIMMLVHAASHPIEKKNVWILVMVLLGVVGSIAYYVMVKREFDKKFFGIHPPSPPTPVTLPPAPQNQTPIQPPQNPPANTL